LKVEGSELPRKVDIWLPGKETSTPMAQGRSTKTISMIKWIRTSRLSIKNSVSLELYLSSVVESMNAKIVKVVCLI